MPAPPLVALEGAVLLPRESLRPNPDQARQFFDENELLNLRASIAEHGILQPLVVRYEPSRFDGTPFIIIGGERRYRASEGVLEELPCIIKDTTAKEARELSLVENLQRRDLSAAEEAAVVREMMENEGLSIRATADRLHKSSGWVTNRLSYLKTGTDVQAVGGRIVKAMSSLLLVDKVKAPEQRAELLHKIEHDLLPHAQVKSRVDTILAAEQAKATAAQFAARSKVAPDAQTETRSNAASRGESAGMSRGQRVTGGANRSEANQEVMRALHNLEAWIKHCDAPTHKKAVELCRRVVRGDLSR